MFFAADRRSKPNSDWLALTLNLLSQYRLQFQSQLTDEDVQALQNLSTKLSTCTITIAVFGKVSTGKTSLINALIGDRLGQTGALHGVTKEVQGYSWQVANGKLILQLIDTPGLDEVNGVERSTMAMTAAEQADLILFVLAGDLTALEQEAIAQLQNQNKPILLIFNKTDLYTDCDRQDIYTSLQSPKVRNLISPQEIIMTASDPQPIRIRHTYDHGQTKGQTYQDIWEKPQPDIQALQQKIIDLLNLEGKALLSINVLRSLREIQTSVTQRHLENIKVRNLAAIFFIIEAIALLNTPWQWLGGCINGTLNSILAIYLINKYPIQKNMIWLMAIIAIAAISGLSTHQPNNYIGNSLGILWIGTSLSILTYGIIIDLNHSQALGRLGAKTFIQKLQDAMPESSILKRIFSIN
jgi:hypothetical protein